MTLTDWVAVVGMITGLTGAVTGIVALALNWMTRRDMKLAQRPVIELSAGRLREPPDGWSRIRIDLRSRSNLGYRVVSVRSIWPLGSRIAPNVDHWYGPRGEITKLIAPIPTPIVDPGLSVKHAGTDPRHSQVTGQVMGSGEEHHSDFLFSAPPSIWSRAFRSLNSARSDSSHTVWARFIVRLIDQNAVITDHRRTVRLTIRRMD